MASTPVRRRPGPPGLFRRSVVLGLVLGLSLAGAGSLLAEPTVKPEARTLWKQAMDFHHAKDPARAIEIFLKAYAADPAVLALQSEGLLDAGIQHYKAQLESKRDDVQYTYRLAELYNLRGDLTEAIRAYKRVAQIAPNSPLAQVASDEARKLEAFSSSGQPAQPSPSPSASVDPAQAGYGKYATGKKDRSAAQLQEAEAKIKELEETVRKAKEETEQVKADLEKLRDEHAKVIEDLRKSQFMPFGWSGSRAKFWGEDKGKE